MRITASSSRAVVFQHGFKDGFARLYSCVLTQGKVRKVPDQFGTYKLAGTFFAYVYAGSAIGDESDKIGVLDLGTYHYRRFRILPTSSTAEPWEIDDLGSDPGYAVNDRGDIVWLVSQPLRDPGRDPTQLTLHAGDGNPAAERIIDSGAIDPHSLRLSDHGRTVKYTKDGQALSAPLDPG
jgi:hypothetical protein